MKFKHTLYRETQRLLVISQKICRCCCLLLLLFVVVLWLVQPYRNKEKKEVGQRRSCKTLCEQREGGRTKKILQNMIDDNGCLWSYFRQTHHSLLTWCGVLGGWVDRECGDFR